MLILKIVQTRQIRAGHRYQMDVYAMLLSLLEANLNSCRNLNFKLDFFEPEQICVHKFSSLSLLGSILSSNPATFLLDFSFNDPPQQETLVLGRFLKLCRPGL